MCNWQGLRGMSASIAALSLCNFFPSDGHSQRASRYRILGRGSSLVDEVRDHWSSPAMRRTSADDDRGYEDGCGSPINDRTLKVMEMEVAESVETDQQAGNYHGYIYYLNLSTPFNASSDFTTVLNNKTVAGGVASNLAPNYVDGVMFSNDDEFYIYGSVALLRRLQLGHLVNVCSVACRAPPMGQILQLMTRSLDMRLINMAPMLPSGLLAGTPKIFPRG
jgi:hypothetical protein